MLKTETVKVNRDAYFLITVVWKDGMTHKIPCRGYNLKSWLDFQKSIEYIEKYSYAETTQKIHDKMVFGS